MRLHLCAVGRLRAGPERALVDDYLDRLGKTGRPSERQAGTVRAFPQRRAA